MWTVDHARNSQSDCFLVGHVGEAPPLQSAKFPVPAMMLGLFGSDSKRMSPFLFDKGVKVRVPERDGEFYGAFADG